MSDELQPSEEVDERQLELAGRAGDAYREAAEYMISEVAETGDHRIVGDYLVGFAQEEAEGMYRMGDDGLEWAEPDEENAHIEVIVADAADGRFLPYVTVRATIDGEDETVGPVEIPFVWHPGLYHYGKNVELPGEGRYDLTIEVEPPTFPRHDETNGDRYEEGVEVTFEDVELTTGNS